jgi:hypothetical protein
MKRPLRFYIVLAAISITIISISCQAAAKQQPTLPPPEITRQSPSLPATTSSPLPTITPSLTHTPIPPSATPTPVPTPTPTPPSPTITSTTNYNRPFLEAIGVNASSCLPDQTQNDIGIYIYDLDNDQELVSINPDVPFQFASTFKGPLLVYFLSRCDKVWNTQSPDWEPYFQDISSVNGIDWYVSEPYKQNLIEHISTAENWNNVGSFLAENRASIGELEGPIDQRYLILDDVYSMVAKSNNTAAGQVLAFVYDECLGDQTKQAEEQCGGSNAITEFNTWFNEFTGIEYTENELRRGMFDWNVILWEDDEGNSHEEKMVTAGLKDICALRHTSLDCSIEHTAVNVFTPRDLFQFYYSLFHLDNEQVKNAALSILKADEPGMSRGFLKNMARKMNAVAMSKNGYAAETHGSVITDAGILNYQEHSYVVVTLSYNALESMKILFGYYNLAGDPTGNVTGLIQELLEGTLPIR